MRHYIMIRSAYSDADLSARRLALTRGVTVPSLTAQSDKRFNLLVRMNEADPLYAERRAAYESVGVPVVVLRGNAFARLTVNDGAGLTEDWRGAVERDEGTLQTRMDDDDALAPDFVARLQGSARPGKRCVYTFPLGYVAVGDTVVRREYRGNQFLTLQTPPGDEGSVYDWTHNALAAQETLVVLDQAPAWLWVRHTGAISVMLGKSYRPGLDLAEALSDIFPGVDWGLISSLAPTSSFTIDPLTRPGRAWSRVLARQEEKRNGGPTFRERSGGATFLEKAALAREGPEGVG